MAVGVTDTKSKSSNITVIFKVIDQATKELNKIASSFSKIDAKVKDSAKASGGAATGFTKFGSAVAKAGAIVAGTVAVFAVASKAISELLQAGEEGAAFLQTTLSFQQMTQAVGVSSDVLDRMRASTQGTISDMQLMSYATTAMAGASGEFGKQIGEALPKLAEIAKAANKANPALGSVDYQFQSLIVGLKRLSPRLIDNTGLQLKLGEAYDAYAEKVGKSTDELSSEEQQLALLNATMEAGDRLLSQVGGNAESLTDPFQQLKADTENLTNQWKAGLYPAAAAVAKVLSEVVQHLANIPATQELGTESDEIEKTATSYQMYVSEMKKAIDGTQFFMVEQDGQIRLMEKVSMGNRDVTVAVGFLTKAQWDAIEATKANDEHMARLASQYDNVVGSADEAAAAQARLKKQMSDLEYVIKGPVSDAYDAHIEKLGDLTKTQDELKAEILALGGTQWLDPTQAEKIMALRGELGGTWGKMKELETAIDEGLGPKKKYAATQQLETLQDQAASLRKELEGMGVKNFNVTPQGMEKLAELEGKLAETEAAIAKETEAWKENQKQIMLDMVQRQLFATLPEGEAIAAYGEVAESMGLIDSQTADAYGMVGELSSLFADKKIDAKEYAEATGLLAKYLGELPEDVTVDLLLRYTQQGTLPTWLTLGGKQDKGGTLLAPGATAYYHAVGGYTEANRPAVFHQREVFMPGRSGYTLASNDLKEIMTEMGFGGGGGGGMMYVDFRGSSVRSSEDIEMLAYRVADHMSKRKR